MTNGLNTFVSSFIWKFFDKTATVLVYFVVQIYLARLLGPKEFGSFAIVSIFLVIGDVLIQGGLNTALIQAKNINNKVCSSLFWISFGVSIFIALILLFSASWISEFFNKKQVENLLYLSLCIFPLNSYVSIQTALFVRRMEFKKMFYLTSFSSITAGVATVFCVNFNFGIYSIIIFYIVNKLIFVVTSIFFDFWRPLCYFNYQGIRKELRFGKNVLIANLISVGYLNLFDVIIGKFYPLQYLSFFSFGKKLPMAAWGIMDSTLQTVLLTTLSKVVNSENNIKQQLRRTLRFSFFLSSVLMLLLNLNAESIIFMLFGKQWLGCVHFFEIFTIIYMLSTIASNNLQAVYANGKGEMILKIEIIKKFFGIVLLFLISYTYKEAIYIVYGELIYCIIANAINIHYCDKVIGYNYIEQFFDLHKIIIACVFSYIITWTTNNYIFSKYFELLFVDQALNIVLASFEFIFIYILTCIIMKEPAVQELKNILAISRNVV